MRATRQIRPILTLPSAAPRAPKLPPNKSSIAHCRCYATPSNLRPTPGPSPRKPVTLTRDDGRVRWGQLTRREKAARATAQSANFTVIIIGAVMTGAVFTYLYKDVFSTDSKTWQFNRAANRIKEDPKCLEVLGDAKEIRAYGEASWNKWTRNRPVASTKSKDQSGNEHLRMHFNVTGPRNTGVVRLHMIKKPEDSNFEYELLAMDVKGHHRIYLEDAKADSKAAKKSRNEGSKIFGIQWRWS